MNRKTLAHIVLLTGLTAAFAASANPQMGAEMVRAFQASAATSATGQGLMVIPANALTGRGAIATPDGRAHF